MVAFGAILLLFAVVGAFVLILDGGDEETSSTTTASPASPAVTLDESLSIRSSGITGGYPKGWRHSDEAGTTTLESPDRCVAIAIGAPAPAAQADGIRRDEIASLRATFDKIDVRPLEAGTLGGLPSSGAVIGIRNRNGAPVVVRLNVAEGRRRAYLVEAVFRRPPCAEALGATDQILQSLEFSR